MKQVLRNLVRRLGYDVMRFETFQGQPVPLRPWESEPAFRKLYGEIVHETLLDVRRLHMLYQCATNAAGLPDGDFAECGVYRGGSAWLIGKIKPADRTLHLFDTFEGMPEVDQERDWHRQGDFADTSLERVRARLAEIPGVDLRAGTFPESARGLENQRFAFVHVDFDIYTAMMAACEFFHPRLVPGGCIILDDYGSPSCPGARAAIDDFCRANHTHVLALHTGQAVLHNFSPSTP